MLWMKQYVLGAVDELAVVEDVPEEQRVAPDLRRGSEALAHQRLHREESESFA